METESTDLALKQASVYEYRTLIRERHLDSFGHVNNAQYMVLFEEARWEMITSRGYGLDVFHQTQVGTAVLECTIRFRRELKLRENITITTSVKTFSGKIVTLEHSVINSSGKEAATAEFVIGCFDLKQRKLIQPTDAWKAAVFGPKQSE